MTKVYCIGAESAINQVDRIRNGFKNNECELVGVENAELIYCNDPSVYNPQFKKINPKAKIIYNVLDLPPHLINGSLYDISRYPKVNTVWRTYNPKDLELKLQNSDAVTCICDEVRWQLQNWCGIKSRVIYNPIKEVSYLNLSDGEKLRNRFGFKYKYLYVGRANDPNKRFEIVYNLMRYLDEPPHLLAVAGTENPGWGDYLGVVNDELLNKLYNSVDYFLFPSAFKSIGLPALEAVVAKTLPVVCEDDPTTKEFFNGIGVDSNPTIMSMIITSKNWIEKTKDFVNKHSEEYRLKFHQDQIAKNILEVYHSI